MSLIEKNHRKKTNRCIYCKTIYIINPDSVKYHENNICKDMLKC